MNANFSLVALAVAGAFSLAACGDKAPPAPAPSTTSTAETVIRGLIYTNSMLLERIKQAVAEEGDEGV